MKIKREFFYIETKRTPSTYGGYNYTLAIYENKGKGKIDLISVIKRNTSSHKGEINEAWETIVLRRPAVKRAVKKFLEFMTIRTNLAHACSYVPHNVIDSLGIKIHGL